MDCTVVFEEYGYKPQMQCEEDQIDWRN